MKLMFCPHCSDVFKLVRYESRHCLCGKVKGKLIDNRVAVINGEGISMMLDNVHLLKTLKKLESMDQDKPESYYKNYAKVGFWIRPNSGHGNPRTKIMKSLFEAPEGQPHSMGNMADQDNKGE